MRDMVRWITQNTKNNMIDVTWNMHVDHVPTGVSLDAYVESIDRPFARIGTVLRKQRDDSKLSADDTRYLPQQTSRTGTNSMSSALLAVGRHRPPTVNVYLQFVLPRAYDGVSKQLNVYAIGKGFVVGDGNVAIERIRVHHASVALRVRWRNRELGDPALLVTVRTDRVKENEKKVKEEKKKQRRSGNRIDAIWDAVYANSTIPTHMSQLSGSRVADMLDGFLHTIKYTNKKKWSLRFTREVAKLRDRKTYTDTDGMRRYPVDVLWNNVVDPEDTSMRASGREVGIVHYFAQLMFVHMGYPLFMFDRYDITYRIAMQSIYMSTRDGARRMPPTPIDVGAIKASYTIMLSTIPSAGRGVFSLRELPRGALIGYYTGTYHNQYWRDTVPIATNTNTNPDINNDVDTNHHVSDYTARIADTNIYVNGAEVIRKRGDAEYAMFGNVINASAAAADANVILYADMSIRATRQIHKWEELFMYSSSVNNTDDGNTPNPRVSPTKQWRAGGDANVSRADTLRSIVRAIDGRGVADVIVAWNRAAASASAAASKEKKKTTKDNQRSDIDRRLIVARKRGEGKKTRTVSHADDDAGLVTVSTISSVPRRSTRYLMQSRKKPTGVDMRVIALHRGELSLDPFLNYVPISSEESASLIGLPDASVYCADAVDVDAIISFIARTRGAYVLVVEFERLQHVDVLHNIASVFSGEFYYDAAHDEIWTTRLL